MSRMLWQIGAVKIDTTANMRTRWDLSGLFLAVKVTVVNDFQNSIDQTVQAPDYTNASRCKIFSKPTTWLLPFQILKVVVTNINSVVTE